MNPIVQKSKEAQPLLNKRRLIDSLEQVAADIVNFATDEANRQALFEIVKSVDDKFIHDSTLKLGNHLFDMDSAIPALYEFLVQDGFEEQILHRVVLTQIIECLSGYDKSNVEDLQTLNLERLREILLNQIQKTAAYETIFTQRIVERINEIFEMKGNRDIRQEADDFVKKYVRAHSAQPAKQPVMEDTVNFSNFKIDISELESLVNSCMLEEASFTPPPAVTHKVSGKLDPAFLANMDKKLKEALSHEAAKLESQSSKQESAEPGVPSKAAFETPNVEKFVRRPRQTLVLNEEQQEAMRNLSLFMNRKMDTVKQKLAKEDALALTLKKSR